MKLLIVEDECELSDSIVSFLCREDYLCEQVFSFAEAAMKVELYEYDCILLDLMLPGGNGLDVLRKIKSTSPQTGVIIVSAKDSLDDKVAGLKCGRLFSQAFSSARIEYAYFCFVEEEMFYEQQHFTEWSDKY